MTAAPMSARARSGGPDAVGCGAQALRQDLPPKGDKDSWDRPTEPEALCP